MEDKDTTQVGVKKKKKIKPSRNRGNDADGYDAGRIIE